MHSLQKYSAHGIDEKVSLLFKIYDRDGNGKLRNRIVRYVRYFTGDGLVMEEDLHAILTACILENNLVIDADELYELSKALFEDASGSKDFITLADLKAYLSKYDGLIDNLGLMIDHLLITTKKSKQSKSNRRSPSILKILSTPYSIGLFGLFTVNIGLFVFRATYFKDFPMLSGYTPNPFYLLSRACGEHTFH